MTASVFDVVDYILSKAGTMTTMKMQKLCYYSHAWNLVWDENPLFPEPIEAWANGPVVRDLYRETRLEFKIAATPKNGAGEPLGNKDNLSDKERASIDAVLGFYGPMTAHQLSELTHREDPWKNARQGIPAGERSKNQITDVEMFEFYDALTAANSNAS